jgi:putative ABC transport system ATP-binding protein
MELFTGLAARTGAGLVVVTHDAEVAARCDRVVRIRDGRTAPEPVAPAPLAGAEA